MVTIKKIKENKYMLQHHADDVFIFQYVIDTDIIEVSIDTFQHMEDAFHDVSFLTEWLIQHFHPTKIRINAPQSLFPILRQNGYYPRGLQYQKCIEPLRKQLQDSIFDSEGYIIDQGSMHSVPFGWFHTDEKGCGWIAAYNLLKYNGKYEDMQTVIHDLEKHMFLGKVFGQELVYLIAYLKQKGLNVHLSLPSKVACMHAIKQYDSGILVYSHARGGHYAAFSKVDDTHVHFYNAIYRRKFHVVELQQFLDKYVMLQGCMMIGCKKGNV